tara:strand:+ start:818 stop:1165 length:348 start_codon:yes stop_codon:yes gene_type:complete
MKDLTAAEQITESMEIIWKKLLDLSKDERISNEGLNAPGMRLFAIVQEMDAALSFLRRDVEGLVTGDSFTMPDEFYEETPPEHWEPTKGEGTTKYVGDFSDYLYMTAPREDGGEK